MDTLKKKILVIVGPTATGKTDIALLLAAKLDGELVACDSRQVYRGLDIGTGKLPSSSGIKVEKHDGYWLINGIKVWMYDIAPPHSQYDVAQYVKAGRATIKAIIKSGKMPIIVGGTGLYLKSLINGFSYTSAPADQALRASLQAQTVEELQQKLGSLSPLRFNKLNPSDRKNPRRLIRAIEVKSMYPYTGTNVITEASIADKYHFLKIGLTSPRPSLYQRINQRVLVWLNRGLIVEVQRLIKEGVSLDRLESLGLEYRLVGKYLKGEIKDLKILTEKMQQSTRQYSKRQLTWFKTDQEIEWFDITEKNFQSKVEKRVLIWYSNEANGT